jgi:hypothetical protein
MLQSALQIQSPPSSVSQPSVSASDASASPSNGYAPSQTSYASLTRPSLAAPALKHESTGSFPSLHEMLADAEDNHKPFDGYSADASMAAGGPGDGGLATSSVSFLANEPPLTTVTSGISSPHLFPWSANPASPSNDNDVVGSRLDSSGMLDPDTPSTPSRRDSGEEDEVEERGRGRQTRYLSGGGNGGGNGSSSSLLGGGEGSWGQVDVAGADGAFRGFDDRGHFGALFASGGGSRSHSRREDVIME